MIRLFIVAASPLSRAGLQDLLVARGLEVIGSSANLDQAGQLPLDADVVLIDSSGVPFEQLLASVVESGLASDARVVLLAEHAPVSAVPRALRAGISAVLPSDLSPDQLLRALEAAASGLLILRPEQVHDALPGSPALRASRDEPVESLTRREREVLQMLAGGLGNKEIAARLAISEHTVKFHVASILGKLGAGSRTEAVSLGIRRGLVLL